MPENFKAPILLKLTGVTGMGSRTRRSSFLTARSACGDEKTRIESLILQ